MKHSQPIVVVHVQHADPFLRDADLAHAFLGNLLQRFPVAGAEIDEMLVDILGDRLQATHRGRKADHGRGWVYWFLAGKFPGQGFGRRDDLAEEASDRVERFHRGSVPYVETSCKDFYSEPSSWRAIKTAVIC
ncbi:MAG: hypothetical protein ACXWPK_17070 [Isosphaeraceae bacterium]